MTGLLDFLPEMDKSTALGLIMAGNNMMNTTKQQGALGAIGGGLQGFAQGLIAQQQQEKEDARQAQQDARQSRLDDSNLALQSAQAQHYLNGGATGDGYHPAQPTNKGYIQWNPVTRQNEFVKIGDEIPLPIGADVGLAGAKSNAVEAEKVGNVTLSDGSVVPMQHKQAIPTMQQPPQGLLNQPLPQKVLQDGQYHDLADYIGAAQQFVPNIMQVESGGNPNAVSDKNARGLMQIIDDTGKKPGMNVIPLQNKSPQENVRFGTDYFAALLKENSGDVNRALSAYNQGQGNLNKNGIINQGYVDSVMNANLPDKIIQASQPLTKNAQQGIDIAVQNGANPKQATSNVVKALNQTVSDLKLGQSTAGKLAQETEAKRQQAEQEARIKLDNVAPTESQKVIGEAKGNAIVQLPNKINALDALQNSLDDISVHPGLSAGTGFIGQATRAFPGTDSHDFAVKAEKFADESFLAQIPQMKGFGALTEAEGKRLVSSFSTLGSFTQSEKQYRSEINNTQKLLSKMRHAAIEQSNQAAPQSSSQPATKQPTISNW